MKYFHRRLQDTIQPWLKKPDILVILGARQVGKTSLLTLLEDDLKGLWGNSKNILTFNLEDTDHLAALNRDPKYFKEYLTFSGADPKKDSVVMIDEIQYLDDPSHFLKYLADFEPTLKLIVTGSTSIQIKKFKDGLTGRKKSFHLFPLDFREFVLFKGEKRLSSIQDKFFFKDILSNQTELDPQTILPFKNDFETLFEEYSLYGGYPKVVLAGSRDEKLQELQEIFKTYELKDVNVLFNVGNISAFRSLFRLMASNIGNLLNIDEVSGTLGIGRDTVKRYLSVLENSFVLHFLHPFHSNVRKELTKMPKLFFLDTGMRNFAIKNFSELSFRPDRGRLFENAIFGELYKDLGVIDQLFFWRTLSKNEVDFILTGNQNIAIEAKLTSDRLLKKPSGLRAFGKIYPEFEHLVATMSQLAFFERIHYLPAWMI
ncbi:MAG: ATP-binding protein [Deltaproteobacteria bacterium]|nr:ATP-binding protein [Deltaproteobacteria bacterium]MBW2035015.1 ATP-binding protein [Deltaproteobacteria bacterium]MBW2119665.1 ATP-binding protein [Deltaproteobacteria bacterium]